METELYTLHVVADLDSAAPKVRAVLENAGVRGLRSEATTFSLPLRPDEPDDAALVIKLLKTGASVSMD